MSDIPYVKTVLIVIGAMLFVYLCITLATSHSDNSVCEGLGDYVPYCGITNGKKTTKEQCATYHNCGYCKSGKGECMEGDKEGPLYLDDECDLSQWEYN